MVLPVSRSAWWALAWGALVVTASCQGGRDKLIADLQSPRPDERALAVKKLAERFDADDLGLFTQAARDPVAIVRAEAMVALGKSSDSRVVDLLGEALGDPDDDVQARAAVALAGVKSDKARAYLTLQYGRRGRATRMVIVQALKSANIPGAMASVVVAEANAIWERNLQALTQGSLPERVGAAEELGKSGRPEAVNRLVPLLKDNQVVLAAAAARGLGYAGDKRAVPALSALLDENFPELREAACEALARLKDPASLPRLLAAAEEHSPSSALAASAIIALPQSPETDKALCQMALAGVGPESLGAAKEMRRRGGCPADAIAEKLKNANTPALVAMIGLGPTAKDLVPKVVPLLTSTDATVRKLAVDALVEMGDPSAAAPVLKAYEAEVKLLEPTRADWVPAELPQKYGSGFDPAVPLPDDDPAAKVRAKTAEVLRKASALQERKLREAGKTTLQARAPKELVDDASEEQLKVLASLVRALGRLKVDGAREKLEGWLKESSPSLRAAASAGLADLGGDALRSAAPGLFDTERQVQAATAAALGEAGPAGQALLLEAIGQLGGDRSRLLEGLRGQPLAPSAVPVLLAVVRDGGADAATAASLLGGIATPTAVEPLLALLEDQTAVARREILVALGRLKDPKAAEGVGHDLYSDSADLRAAAAEALASLGASGATAEALDALKGDYSVQVRESAQAALAHLNPGEKR